MQDSSRRKFLALAGTSAVAGAALAAAPGASAKPAAETDSESLPRNAEKALTAYIRNTSTGEVLLMSEGHEVTITDRKLVARLAHAFDRAAK